MRCSVLDDIAFVLGVVVRDLLDNQTLDFNQVERRVRLKREIDGAFELWLVLRIVQILQESVLQRHVHFYSCLWVHIEHFVEEVDGLGRLRWEQLLQVNFRLFRQGFDVLEGILIGYLLASGLIWRASTVNNQVYLLNVVLAREHNAARHDFSERAPSAPNVHIVAILVR